MNIYRYQTITVKVRLANPSKLEGMTEAAVSVKQAYTIGHFLYSDGSLDVDTENGILTCSLSQEDTAKFQSGRPIIVQVNISINNGAQRLVSKKVLTDEVEDNLYEVVMN